MDKWRCLIVDDEPIARNIIESYCSNLPYLEVVASSGNAIEAKMILQQQEIDLIFLDINMPVMDGISFLKTLRSPLQVIFTTAYKEYALDAFDLAACDYLLKPFSFERFVVAVDKAVALLKTGQARSDNLPPAKEDFLFIKADGRIYRIAFQEIFYAEASGNYTRVVTDKNIYLPAMTFAAIEELLPSSLFIRVHRSFIINKSHISHIEGNRVFINKTEIPIGSNYKEQFLKEIGMA